MSDVLNSGLKHGRKREKTSEEATRVRRQKEASKIKAYRDLVEKCRSQVKNGQFDADTLLLTTHILQQNPDFYTIWNYRRNILLRGILQQDPAKDRPVFCKELDFFMQVIRINPKSYWLWNHRLWCLQTMPDPDWKAELGLVEKMLAMDARNFHGWDYRRYVVKKLKANAVDEQEEKAIIKREYDFTTKKIYDNFSNYSAWHQRSKLLPAIVAPLSMEEKNQKAREELDLVKNAVYTDPNDQSAWLYYRWLIGHTPSTISVLGAFRLSGLDKIVLIFSRNVTLLKTPSITTVEDQSVNGQWCYANQRSNTNRVYIFNPTESLPQDITIRIFANSVAAAHSKFDSSWEGTPVQLATDSSITEIVAANLKNATEFSESRYTDLIENYHPSWYTLDRIELLNEEIQAVRDLLEEEPHSKWALETLAHFLEQLKLNDAMTDCQNINIEIMGIFEKLEELDLYRKQRYQDARNALKWDMDSHVVSEAYKKQSVTGKSAELLLEVFKQELCG